MGAKGAVISFAKRKRPPSFPRAKPNTRQVLQPFVAGARGFIDDVIQPHATRNPIAAARMLINTKVETRGASTGTFRFDEAPQLRSCPRGAPPGGPAEPDPRALLDVGFATLARLLNEN